MAGCNQTVEFKLDTFSDYEFKDMPKGEFLRVAMNPYTGMVFIHYTDNPRTNPVIEDVFNQVEREVKRLRIWHDPHSSLLDLTRFLSGKIQPVVIAEKLKALPGRKKSVGAIGKEFENVG